MKKILLILISLALLGCSDGGVETINSPISGEVNALLSEVQVLESGLSGDLIMRSSTRDERENIKNDLMLCRILGIRLNERPNDGLALSELFKTLKRLESFPFSSQDAGLFERVLYQLRVALDKYATIQNVDLLGLEWTLYNFKFSSELAPYKSFNTFASSPVWKFGRGGGSSFAKVESRKVKADAWLVTPYLNLENSRKQLLVIGHTVRNPEWKNFKMLISDDYDGRDPKNSNWKEFSLKPSGNVARDQWVNLTSNQIDISEYSGKKITIAFQFLADESSNSVWEILSVEIKGTGDSVATEDIEIIYTPENNDSEDIN